MAFLKSQVLRRTQGTAVAGSGYPSFGAVPSGLPHDKGAYGGIPGTGKAPQAFTVDPLRLSSFLSMKKQAWFPEVLYLMNLAQGAILGATCSQLQDSYQAAQASLDKLYSTHFPGQGSVLSPAIAQAGQGNNAKVIPAIQLIQKLGLRFCSLPSPDHAYPSSDPAWCCLPPDSVDARVGNRAYRRQLIMLSVGILGNCEWTAPVWDPNCVTKSIGVNVTKGCVGAYPKQANYLNQSSAGQCFAPSNYQWVSLACCSQAAYTLLSPLNLSELEGIRSGLSLPIPLYNSAQPIPSREEWIKISRNALVIDTLNTARALGLVSTKDKFDALALNVASVLWHLSPAMGGLGFSKVGWSGQLT